MARIWASFLLTGLALSLAACAGAGTNNPTALIPVAGREEALATARTDDRHVRIREFKDLPKYGSGSALYSPGALAAGSDGLLWVIDGIDQDFGADVVVGIDTSGKAKHHYYAASNYFGYQDITSGSDGALWLTDGYNNRIVRLTTSGQLTQFPEYQYTQPWSIAAGPDRALWFTAYGAIGRITTKGKLKMYPANAEYGDICAGPDDALWFTESYPSAGIGRITTHGKVTSYTSGITGKPGSIALGPDGALWFTERGTGGPKIGRITISGNVTEYTKGISTGEYLADIAAGPDGAMWFTETTFGYYYSPQIGRVSMSGRINEYSKGLPTQAGPSGIVQGPDQRMWFTDSFNNETGRLTP